MRRSVVPVLVALLLVSGWGHRAAAQRGPVPVLDIQEPRPAPVLPVALVPFTIGPEACQKGHQPVVTFEVYNVLARPEATLRLRTRRFEEISALPMRCGSHVAIWDGTIDNGQRLARPGLYYLRLTLDDGRSKVIKLRVREP